MKGGWWGQEPEVGISPQIGRGFRCCAMKKDDTVSTTGLNRQTEQCRGRENPEIDRFNLIHDKRDVSV